jgi:hypothetical protein
MKLRHSTLTQHFSLNYVRILCPHTLHEITSQYSVATLYVKLPVVAVRSFSTPASYFGGPAFIFRSGYRLSCRVSRDFPHSHCNAFLMRARPAASASFTSHYLTVILPSSYPEYAEPYLRALVHHHDLVIKSFPDISQFLTPVPCHKPVSAIRRLYAACRDNFSPVCSLPVRI